MGARQRSGVSGAITRLVIRTAWISALTLIAASCTGDSKPTDAGAAVASVVLDRTTLSVEQGKLAALVATARDASGATLVGRTVSWSSDANSIATVSPSGAVTGVAVGSTTIRATSEGKSASAQVTVTPIAVATVTLDRTALSLEQGTTTTLVATLRDATGAIITGRDITWSSDANPVATVSQSGLVTGVAVGIANITATREGKSMMAQVTVTPIPVATVVLDKTAAEITVGTTTTFSAEARSIAGQLLTGRYIAWTAADVTVVSVADGVVTALAPGNTTITATSEGKTATATIKVNPATCVSSVATGRLSGPTNNEFTYTTLTGWVIKINRSRLLITTPNPQQSNYYELWGSNHENVGGKHIKDILNDRRTILLPGGVIITVPVTPQAPDNRVNGMEWVQWISIYEGNETHRIDMQTFAVAQSCALPMFGEADEHDGETASIYFTDTGMRMENVYQQDATPAGVPTQKIFGTFLLATTSFANPNQVNDFFDDPRLGHTWW